MDELRELDQVAYVRFASVYREFKDVSQFLDELKPILESRGPATGQPPPNPSTSRSPSKS